MTFTPPSQLDREQADINTISMLIGDILNEEFTIEHNPKESYTRKWVIKSERQGDIGTGNNLIEATRYAISEIVSKRILFTLLLKERVKFPFSADSDS